MTYTPPGYKPSAAIGEGTHTLYLSELKQGDAGKFNCAVCFIATYKNPENGAEITDFMKWGANPAADRIASMRMEDLVAAAGLTGSPSPDEVAKALDGVPLTVEVKENKGYTNVWSVKGALAGSLNPDAF